MYPLKNVLSMAAKPSCAQTVRHHHSLVQAGSQLEKEKTATIESMLRAGSGKEKGGGTRRLSSLHFLLFQTPLLLHFFSTTSRLSPGTLSIVAH